MALYAAVKAGYAPDSFASFLNSSMLNNGKTGNWLSDFFGLTHESTKRYRAARKLIDALPQACRSKQPGTSEAFQNWTGAVLGERLKTAQKNVSDDKTVTLDPPLRASLWRIRFSLNGKYILAQDEAGITVLDRDAEKSLFRIDAPDAEAGQFSPDSTTVVFQDAKLRVEQWSVATGKRIRSKELVVLEGCTQTALSPDGKVLVCAYVNFHGEMIQLGLRLLDVENGQTIFDKANFAEPDTFSPYAYRLYIAKESGDPMYVMNASVSPDGKFLMVSAGNRQLAYDLESRRMLQLGGKLKSVQNRSVFFGPDQLFSLGNYKSNGKFEARLFKFPSGEVIKETEMENIAFDAVTKGQNLIVGPLKDYAVGIYDPMQSKVLTALKMSTIDVWDSTMALEDASGGVAIAPIGSVNAKNISLPLGVLPKPRAAAFSSDGKYLVVSMRNRADIWDLNSGKQVRLVRPFRSVWMDKADRIYGQFPKYLNRDAEEMQITVEPFASKSLGKLEDEDTQYRDLKFRLKPLGKYKGIREHATLEFKKMDTQAVAWTRDYPHETPVCWPADDDRLVLAWDLSSDTAKSEVKSNPVLQKEADALTNKKKGLLVETVAPYTGAPLQQVIVPEVDLSGGWNDRRHATVSGEFVLARGEHGNTSIYKIGDGSKVGEFFGTPVASDATVGVIAAVNREDEIILVDEHTGKELRRLTLGSPVRLAQIVTGKETALLVLTADQVVHRISIHP